MKKKFVFFALGVIAMLACSLFAPAPTAAPQTELPATGAPTVTEAPTATELPTAIVTETPVVATATDSPVVSLASTIVLPQQWNGVITGYDVGKTNQNQLSLIIDKMDGGSFTGKVLMSATADVKSKTYSVAGEFVTDFSVDEKKWSYHEDYKKGGRGGTWLKLTYLSMLSGKEGRAGLWWYAHIADNKMTAIVFSSSAKEEPQNGAKVELELLEPKIPSLPLISSRVVKIDPAVLKDAHQWSGDFTGQMKSKTPTSQFAALRTVLKTEPIALIISDMEGDFDFVGQMSWIALGVLTQVNGSFIDDFASEDESELIRWSSHEDYKNGDRSGVWLKWNEIRVLKGGGYAEGGWYYGHIRSDGSMVGIHFFNSKSSTPAGNDYFVLNLLQ